MTDELRAELVETKRRYRENIAAGQGDAHPGLACWDTLVYIKVYNPRSGCGYRAVHRLPGCLRDTALLGTQPRQGRAALRPLACLGDVAQ